MATYKKRGHKPKTKEEKQAALEEQSATAEVFNTLDEGASKTEQWVAKNQKYLFVIIGIVAVGVLGYLAYNEYVIKPNQLEATNEMSQAQVYFEQALDAPQQDSLYNLALNGGQGKYGFLDIIDNYGGTDAGNLARYYAGVSYMKLGKYAEAIDYLEDFKPKDAMLGPIAKGNIGDAFAQLDQKEEALEYYKEAATLNENEFTSPKYLLKAAIISLQLGNGSEALEYLNKIKNDFPNATEASQIDVYIGQAEAMN
ncbi:MAG: tetratricopeptide repeat protein [Flavobacteriaceae bacterium]